MAHRSGARHGHGAADRTFHLCQRGKGRLYFSLPRLRGRVGRGPFRESEPEEAAPRPDPLRSPSKTGVNALMASGERGQTRRARCDGLGAKMVCPRARPFARPRERRNRSLQVGRRAGQGVGAALPSRPPRSRLLPNRRARMARTPPGSGGSPEARDGRVRSSPRGSCLRGSQNSATRWCPARAQVSPRSVRNGCHQW